MWHDAFYLFTPLDDPEQMVLELKELTQRLQLDGSILVASEGINGMLAAEAEQLDAFWHALANETRFRPLAPTTYKRTFSKERPFSKLKVKLKREIVPLGIDGVDATSKTGIDVPPAQWREMLKDDELILIDNRNDFEVRLGKFKNAINPDVDNFRDFPAWMEAHLPEWEDKKIAMYCTGGIRCEKTSSWLLDKGIEVYQLEGGILNYFAKVDEPEREWEGECFVFDDRVSLDVNLQETTTTYDDVYDPMKPDEAWRRDRAERMHDILARGQTTDSATDNSNDGQDDDDDVQACGWSPQRNTKTADVQG